MTTEGHTARISLTAEQAELVRLELDRILKSPPFQSSRRCHDFLHYIVERTLDGELDSLTERFLGAELFGRPIDYDTKSDSIVRVRANDVRRRLAECYADHHLSPDVVISLSTGSYIPEFHWADKDQHDAGGAAPVIPGSSLPSSESWGRDELAVSNLHNESAHSLAVENRSDAEHSRSTDGSVSDSEKPLATIADLRQGRPGVSRRVAAVGSIVGGLVILGLAICSFTLWQQLRSARHTLYPWQNSRAVAGFWGSFLNDQRETDLVLADASFSLVQDLAGKSFGLSDYLSRSYMNQLQDQDPKLGSALNTISTWGLGSSVEFEVSQRILALDPARQKLHLYVARKYQPDLIRRDNVILLGSRYGNPWVGLFEKQLNFTFSPTNPNEIVNRAPKDGESRTYEFGTPGSDGYCIIDYLPSPDHDGSVLLIQGTSGEPTEAGGDFLLSEEKMSGFQKMLGVSKLPYFELLLRASWVKGTPIASSIVAYRTYSGSN